MKIKFTFTDSPDLPSLTADYRYQSPFEVPDTALQLADCRDRILTIGQLIGQLTHAILYVSCKELELKDYPVKLVLGDDSKPIWYTWHDLVIQFSRSAPKIHRDFLVKQDMKIWLPIYHTYTGITEAERSYKGLIQSVAEQFLALLNSEPITNEHERWQYIGFIPYQRDNATFKRVQKLNRKRQSEDRKRERLEQKRKEREADAIASGTVEQVAKLPSGTGAGRRIGAVPGIFKGVQFRSQLEIRFATQLEAKQIRWVYETERLGEGNYLVDFYLPQMKCWVEVKGQFEPRDHYLLRDVAAYLEREREERLFVYTQAKAFKVTFQEFEQISHQEFWSKI
ncbi:MAG: hypothetical protein ABI947_09025 [Chloroflexota bacterium]